jgi:multiple sugar transport system permease protein
MYIVLTLLAIASLVPFAWAVSSSLKSEAETFNRPYAWIPQSWAWDNYVKIFQKVPFARFFVNTIIQVAGRLAMVLFVVPMAGYALARKQFPGRDLVFIAILSLMMIPRETTLVPLFVIAKNFPLLGGNNILGKGGTGMLNSYIGLIVPHAVSPFSIFMMRQFFWTLPENMEEAAKIDGASEWQIYWRIALPVAKPGLTALGIFAFQDAWNDFIWPLIILRSREMFTIQLGLQAFQDEVGALWAQLMAATVTVTIPIIIVFALFQKYFFQGISFAGLTDK